MGLFGPTSSGSIIDRVRTAGGGGAGDDVDVIVARARRERASKRRLRRPASGLCRQKMKKTK